MNVSANDLAEKQARLRKLQQEQQLLQEELKVQQFAANYEIELEWPATINGNNRRTNDELIQHRLLEAGVLYEVPVSVGDTVRATTEFIADLKRTGCFESVRVELGNSSSSEEPSAESATTPQRCLKVHLHEANWYRLHAGAGLKTDSLWHPEQQQSGGMPTAEVEASLRLRNLSGFLDKTMLQYTLDTKSIAALSLVHERPLYSMLPNGLSRAVLEHVQGSQYALRARAAIDTVDYEWTRSYKEFQRLLSVTACNTHSLSKEQTPWSYTALEWSTVLRDIVPRRHATMPYAFEASPAIVSQAGPSVKHSLTAEVRTGGEFMDHVYNPTEGIEAHTEAEVALPPGDVGFAKVQGGMSLHVPIRIRSLSSSISLHGAVNAGYLRHLAFGGICRPPTISDRFFVGGPMSLRGFQPSGIGPRAYSTSSTSNKDTVPKNPPGDALGGDFYYTATAMASVTPALLKMMVSPEVASAVRLFGFVNVGTCVGSIHSTPLVAVLQSTRASVGIGLVTAAIGPRVEFTYSWPLRHGPRDVRRHFQFGMGFTFG